MTRAQEKYVEVNLISLPPFLHPAICLQSCIHPFIHPCLFSLHPMKPVLPSSGLCKHALQILFMQAVRHWPVLFMRKLFFLAAGATQTFDIHKMALIFKNTNKDSIALNMQLFGVIATSFIVPFRIHLLTVVFRQIS